VKHFDDIVGSNGRYNRQRRYNIMAESEGILPLPRDDRLDLFIASVGLT
jgi:hypothetical protein